MKLSDMGRVKEILARREALEMSITYFVRAGQIELASGITIYSDVDKPLFDTVIGWMSEKHAQTGAGLRDLGVDPETTMNVVL